MRLGGIVETSTVDWPGQISLVVFLAGCNFNCPYCHNAELIPTTSGWTAPLLDVTDTIDENLDLIDAVVISGGEPTLQPAACSAILTHAKQRGLRTMIETNGSRPMILYDLIVEGALDRVAIDWKTSPIKYALVSGQPPYEALDTCRNLGVELEIRTTRAPDLVTDEDLDWIQGVIPPGAMWTIQEART
jgi:pyruvate formate lyase activating enzyme